MKLSFHKACFLHVGISIESPPFTFLWLFCHSFYFHREKIPLHVFSPKYTKLRDWHHEVSARALNVQWLWALLSHPSSQHTPFIHIFFLQFHSSICFTFGSWKLEHFNAFLTISNCENEKNEHVVSLFVPYKCKSKERKGSD